MQEWWWASGETRNGPVTQQALRELMLAGKVSADTLVWTAGQAKWERLSEVAQLRQMLDEQLPPELPKPTPSERLTSQPLAGPWRRWTARIIDIWVISLPIGLIVATALLMYSPYYASWSETAGADYIFGWLILPLVMLIEAGVFALFGTTVGKSLAGVQVITLDGQRPTLAQYLSRQVGVYWFGLGTGVPFLAAIPMARQHRHLSAGRPTGYDEGKFIVKTVPGSKWRTAIAVLVVIVILVIYGAAQQEARKKTTWVNPQTGKSLTLPDGWTWSAETVEGTEGNVAYVFKNNDTDVVALYRHSGQTGENGELVRALAKEMIRQRHKHGVEYGTGPDRGRVGDLNVLTATGTREGILWTTKMAMARSSIWATIAFTSDPMPERQKQLQDDLLRTIE